MKNTYPPECLAFKMITNTSSPIAPKIGDVVEIVDVVYGGGRLYAVYVRNVECRDAQHSLYTDGFSVNGWALYPREMVPLTAAARDLFADAE